jgi:hypothetical protein
MKRLNGWGEKGGVPADFFLRPARKFPRFPADIPEISGNSVIVPSLDRKRFPPWAYAKLPYRAWENCSGQCKGLFQAQKRKITMSSNENRNFCHSVWAGRSLQWCGVAPLVVRRLALRQARGRFLAR